MDKDFKRITIQVGMTVRKDLSPKSIVEEVSEAISSWMGSASWYNDKETTFRATEEKE